LPLAEDVRQEYLQEMGIDSYYPRLKLPSAPESSQVEWPESWQQELNAGKAPEESKVSQAPSSAAKTDISTPIPATPNPVSPNPRTPNPITRPSSTFAAGTKREDSDVDAEHVSNPGTKAQPEEYRLQLVCIRVNESLAILNVMPHIGPKSLPVRHLKLLQNLLKVSGIPHESLLVEEKPFHWPMVQGQQIDNSKYAAASALIAYLQQKMSDWQFSKLLVMGEQTITEVFAAEELEIQEIQEVQEDQKTQDEKDRAVIDIESQDWQTYYTRSLDETLQRPVLKKELWQTIRKLKA
jgi:hypothetical protein